MHALLLALLLPAAGAPPQPVFYLPFEGSATAPVAGGSPQPIRRSVGQSDTILDLLALGRERFVPGRVGRACDIGDQPLAYECAGNFRAAEGTASFWVSPDWRGDDHTRYSTLFGAADWGMVYKYTDQSSLTFGTAKPDTDLYYDCGTGAIAGWQPGEWHHVAVTWSQRENQRRIYVDGKRCAAAPFPWHKTVERGPLFVGAGCTLYPNPVAHAKLDEFALWNAPLDDAAVAEVYALGQAGRPLADVAPPPGPPAGGLPPASPATPPPPEENSPRAEHTGQGDEVSLDGWWAFVPLAEPDDAPPERWGLSRVPGYWTVPGDALDPDGKPVSGAWGGKPLTSYAAGRYERAFTADPAWRDRHVLLQLGGVDGLAEVYANGHRLGWLTSWEPEGWDITDDVRFGEANTITLLLRSRGGAAHAGIYGDVRLCIVSGPYIRDCVVRPHVAAGKLEVSCDVYVPEKRGQATFSRKSSLTPFSEFELRAAGQPDKVVKLFRRACRLEAKEGEALSDRYCRVEAEFEWPDAHPWSIDDPFLYDVVVSLRDGDQVLARSRPYRFGFRELVQQGGDFLLNGKPFHLRGHQIDFAWGSQMDRVRELKAAGLNALELSGPITCEWYRGIPYQQKRFEQVLDYCDAHGLIAAPILPDLEVLRDQVFDPRVAPRYRRRLEQHIRQYGNHPSVGLWYMDFNLAGYLWYCAPSKLDGVYKPTDAGFRQKERYALEAERLAHEVDPRPIYHHACGNFGHQVTSNLYLGPNSPTQEREEWPSAWAAQSTVPFVAAEHCLWLIPYWFRPRQFPLSVVYAGEPIFDELTALVRGPEAYAEISPELFERYDMDRQPGGDRTRSLIRHHPGYQAAKSEIARLSLRAWRTWGVSGILFNAENWDWIGDHGEPLPAMKAMARYFGDTDLYIAGAPGDWPSKDHAFYAGETIRKQVVLLNDLQHDIPVSLRWRLVSAAGKELAAGRLAMVSKAGVPTFAPLEVKAPAVTARAEYRLQVDPIPGRGDRQVARGTGRATRRTGDLPVAPTGSAPLLPDALPIQVFPRPAPAAPGGVVVYDPVGDTSAMLRRAAVRFTPLTGNAELGAGARILVVGRKAWDAAFMARAKALGLEAAIRAGLRLVVFEQTAAAPFGLKLEETSTRDAFFAQAGHPLLAGLEPADMRDLRARSDLLEPYPDAAPETEHRWPARCWKWGNRGVVATYVFLKPHYAPFRPVLQCGFDLTQSPLLEARYGKGLVTLCQVDVTPRCGTDPVATRLVANLLGQRVVPAQAPCSFVGASAAEFLAPFGLAPAPFQPGAQGVVFVGKETPGETVTAQLEQAARGGATVVLLPRAAGFGLRLADQRWFIGRLKRDPLLAGLNDGDLYLKSWKTTPAVPAEGGWESLVEPGVLAVKALGQGRLVACEVDPEQLGARGRAKALRFWNVLLANLGAEREANAAFVTAPAKAWEESESEQLPPYMGW